MAVIGESGESKGWVNGGVAMAPEREREREFLWDYVSPPSPRN